MWKRTIKFSPDQTAEQRAWQVKWTQRDDAMRAEMCNGLQFWRSCRIGECRRRHACSGDPQACFERNWAAIPETEKAWFRAFVTARKEGLPPDQAKARADAEFARIAELEAAAQRARDAARTPPATPPKPEPPMPRIRQL